MLANITPLILTYNEAPNIGRTLGQLSWARDIVIVDSFSDDETLDVVAGFPQARVVQRKFDSFAGQCNFGLGKIGTEWVLSLDADYILTNDLIEEIRSLPASAETDAYTVSFKYCVWGKLLRGTLYPPRKILYRRLKAIYVDDGHAHHVNIDGPCATLSSFIHHDDRKPLTRWMASQAKYVTSECEKLAGGAHDRLSVSDRLRKLKTLAPLLVLFYCLILYRGVLDGWPGWYYAFQRALAEFLLALNMIARENLAECTDFEAWAELESEEAAYQAQRLLSTLGTRIMLRDHLRRLKILMPVLMTPYVLFGCGEILSGWRGWHSAYRKTCFELMLAIQLIEMEHITDEILGTEGRTVAS